MRVINFFFTLVALVWLLSRPVAWIYKGQYKGQGFGKKLLFLLLFELIFLCAPILAFWLEGQFAGKAPLVDLPTAAFYWAILLAVAIPLLWWRQRKKRKAANEKEIRDWLEKSSPKL